MPIWDKMMLCKRCIIETINYMLKKHRSASDFITKWGSIYNRYFASMAMLPVFRFSEEHERLSVEALLLL